MGKRMRGFLTLKSLGDVALIGAGLALAGLSIGFASYMVALGDHEPRINGLEYLAIFAQPRGAREIVERSASSAPPRAAAVDPTPTGSIAPRPPQANEPPEIVTAERDRAWIKINGTIRAAALGDSVPGLGRIGAIVERGGRWVLLDETGAELAASAAPRGADGAAPFTRPMIFDRAQR